jgi:hypothetical protein
MLDNRRMLESVVALEIECDDLSVDKPHLRRLSRGEVSDWLKRWPDSGGGIPVEMLREILQHADDPAAVHVKSWAQGERGRAVYRSILIDKPHDSVIADNGLVQFASEGKPDAAHLVTPSRNVHQEGKVTLFDPYSARFTLPIQWTEPWVPFFRDKTELDTVRAVTSSIEEIGNGLVRVITNADTPASEELIFSKDYGILIEARSKFALLRAESIARTSSGLAIPYRTALAFFDREGNLSALTLRAVLNCKINQDIDEQCMQPGIKGSWLVVRDFPVFGDGRLRLPHDVPDVVNYVSERVRPGSAVELSTELRWWKFAIVGCLVCLFGVFLVARKRLAA